MQEQLRWTGISGNVALASANRKTFSTQDEPTPKRIQASGPSTGTWTATVKVYRSEDNRKDVLAATLSISNATPSDMVELISTCANWNYSVEGVTGSIPSTPDSDGQGNVTVTVGG